MLIPQRAFSTLPQAISNTALKYCFWLTMTGMGDSVHSVLQSAKIKYEMGENFYIVSLSQRDTRGTNDQYLTSFFSLGYTSVIIFL